MAGFDKTLIHVLDSGGTIVAVRSDLSGRPFADGFTVHDATNTATATLTTGTPATLASAVPGRFLDLVEVSFANNSGAAQVQLLDDGTPVRTFQVPASTTLQAVFDPPVPQSSPNSVWQADMEDVTGSTVTVNATFLRNLPR